MKVFSIILFFTIISCSTQSKEEIRPEGLISEEQMMFVLKDIQIAEAHTKLSKLHRDSIQKLNLALYNSILIKNNIDSNQFISSYKFYVNRPKALNRIYESLLETLLKEDANTTTDNQ